MLVSVIIEKKEVAQQKMRPLIMKHHSSALGAYSLFFFVLFFLPFVMPSTPLFTWFMFYICVSHIFPPFWWGITWHTRARHAALVGPINLISTYQNFVYYFIFGSISFVSHVSRRPDQLLARETPNMFSVWFSSSVVFRCRLPCVRQSPQVIINSNCCN